MRPRPAARDIRTSLTVTVTLMDDHTYDGIVALPSFRLPMLFAVRPAGRAQVKAIPPRGKMTKGAQRSIPKRMRRRIGAIPTARRATGSKKMMTAKTKRTKKRTRRWSCESLAHLDDKRLRRRPRQEHPLIRIFVKVDRAHEAMDKTPDTVPADSNRPKRSHR